MKASLHLMKKEILLLMRDWHALVLLFVMPAAFILIMSLALQNRFSAQSGVHIGYYLLNGDTGAVDVALLKGLRAMHGFQALPTTASQRELEAQVRNGKPRFVLIVPPGFGESLASDTPVPLRIWRHRMFSLPCIGCFSPVCVKCWPRCI